MILTAKKFWISNVLLYAEILSGAKSMKIIDEADGVDWDAER